MIPLMRDTQPTELYEKLRDTAAHEWIDKVGGKYSGGKQAEGWPLEQLKQAFDLGADTSLQYPQILGGGVAIWYKEAVRAGRAWGLTEKVTRRLVAVGKKSADFSTRTIKVDTSSRAVVDAAGLPQWTPDGKDSGPDPDLLRKQQIEDALARGDDQ